MGYLESSLEHYDTAWAYLDPSDPATGEPPLECPVVHVPEMVEVLAALGRSDEARGEIGAVQPTVPPCWIDAGRSPAPRHCRGFILAAEGDLEPAAHALHDAVDQGAANGWPIPSAADCSRWFGAASTPRQSRRPT